MATRKKAAKRGQSAKRQRATRRIARKTSELEELLRELIAKIDLLVSELREGRLPSRRMATALTKKPITADTIWERIRQIFGADTKSNTPLKKKYFGDLGGLADMLNAHPPFAADKLHLMPGNLKGVDSMGGVGAAIVKWYKSNGWTVTVDFD